MNGETSFTDLIRGKITFQNKDLDDWVILRTDKAPTYNFTVVIDDYEQRITHVLRGDDHINNTPKQIQLYNLLGFPVPSFAHLPDTERAAILAYLAAMRSQKVCPAGQC